MHPGPPCPYNCLPLSQAVQAAAGRAASGEQRRGRGAAPEARAGCGAAGQAAGGRWVLGWAAGLRWAGVARLLCTHRHKLPLFSHERQVMMMQHRPLPPRCCPQLLCTRWHAAAGVDEATLVQLCSDAAHSCVAAASAGAQAAAAEQQQQQQPDSAFGAAGCLAVSTALLSLSSLYSEQPVWRCCCCCSLLCIGPLRRRCLCGSPACAALVAACLTRAPCGVPSRFGAGRRRATWLGGGGGGGSGLGLLSSFRRRGTAS